MPHREHATRSFRFQDFPDVVEGLVGQLGERRSDHFPGFSESVKVLSKAHHRLAYGRNSNQVPGARNIVILFNYFHAVVTVEVTSFELAVDSAVDGCQIPESPARTSQI